MMQDIGLNREILASLKTIFKNHLAVELVKIYGSRAKGTFRERSDIDLVVYGQELNRFIIADLLMDLDDLNIPYMVDLQSYHDLKNRSLIEHINRVGIVIYDRT